MARTKRPLGSRSHFSFRPGIEQLEDRAVPSAVDLSVQKALTSGADSSGNVFAGDQVTYAITVQNLSGNTATDATLTDTVPAALRNVTWTSPTVTGVSGNTPSGTGNINETITLDPNASITYTVTATVSSTASGALDNTATVAPGPNDTDATTANDTSTASATVVQPAFDVGVTKTDGLSTVAPGQTVTYTVLVTNNGTSALSGSDAVTFTDTLPTNLTNVSYTSTVTGGATGNTGGSGAVTVSGTSFSDTLSLPVGATVTYMVTGTVSTSAVAGTDSVVNEATVSTAQDQVGGNDTATDTDAVGAPNGPVDLAITKTDNSKFAIDGRPVTYTITVSNLGTTTASGATVSDMLPPTLKGSSWTSSYSGGAAGHSGTGDLNDTITLAPGQSITYTLTATVSPSAHGKVINVATVAPAAGVTDSNMANNTARDRDTILPKNVPAYYNQYAVGADAGAQGHVKVFDSGGKQRMSFLAFPGFNGGVRVATGDFDGDGVNDIVVSAGPGAPNGHVKVFDGVDGHLLASFFAFRDFLGGTNVAVGDVNNDGSEDLIVGSGMGVGHVKVFSFATGTPQLIASFFAYPGYHGGITVAAGDVNGDGYDDIITGTADKSAHLKVFSLASGRPEEVFSQIVIPNYRGGIDVAAGDIRGDSRAEFLAVPMSAGGGGAVQIFSIDSATPIASFVPSFSGPPAGLRVAVADADGDGDNDIIVASGRGRQAQVQAYTGDTLQLIKEFSAFDNFLGGVYLG